MSCDVGEVTKRLENELCSQRHNSFSNPSLALPKSQLCSFSNLSVTSPTSQLILQPFLRFTYVTAQSPTLPFLHLRHSSFSNPSFASPTSQALHLIYWRAAHGLVPKYYSKIICKNEVICLQIQGYNSIMILIKGPVCSCEGLYTFGFAFILQSIVKSHVS